jgi:[acyl-carrier-protein] S-malonyltransferase
MAAVIGLEVEKLAAVCVEAHEQTGGIIQIANDNCPGQSVISGDAESLALAMEQARAAGARKVVRLAVSIAAHTPLMSVVADEFSAAVDAAPITDAEVPLIANVSAKPIVSADDIQVELRSQLTSGVRWTESMQYLVAQNIAMVVEVGPKSVLTGLMRRIDRKIDRLNIGDEVIEPVTESG